MTYEIVVFLLIAFSLVLNLLLHMIHLRRVDSIQKFLFEDILKGDKK